MLCHLSILPSTFSGSLMCRAPFCLSAAGGVGGMDLWPKTLCLQGGGRMHREGLSGFESFVPLTFPSQATSEAPGTLRDEQLWSLPEAE